MNVFDIFSGEISKAKFATAYSPAADVDIAPMSELSITETAYIPPEVQIKDMMDAGTRLAFERRARFETIKAEGEEELPITRKNGIDIVDVVKEAVAVEKRLAAQQLAAQEKAVKESEVADEARIQAAVKAALEAKQTQVK
jgi:hypothetical protein